MVEKQELTIEELIEHLETSGSDILDVDPLEPGNEPFPVLIDVPTGEVLDGFHRVSGFAVWADDDPERLEEYVEVIVVEDDNLAGLIANAENQTVQQAAIALAMAIVE